MNMRPTGTTNSSFTQPTDKRIGDAFPIVEEVYKHLDQLKYLAENSDKLIGKQIEFRANEELQAIQWRYTGQDDWVTLLTYAELVGVDLTQVEETLNQIIDNGVSKLAEDFQPVAREALKNAILAFGDYASASAAATMLPDGQVIETEDTEGRLSRYEVLGGVMVFKSHLDQLREDLKSEAIGAKIVARAVYGVGTIAELRSQGAPERPTTVVVNGYFAAADGGGGVYVWDSSSTKPDDAGEVIAPDGHAGSGRWIRQTSLLTGMVYGGLNDKFGGSNTIAGDRAGVLLKGGGAGLTKNYATIYGFRAAEQLESTAEDTFVGTFAGSAVTESTYCAAVGYGAMRGMETSPGSGTFRPMTATGSTAIGAGALQNGVSHVNTTALGALAGRELNSTSNVTLFGQAVAAVSKNLSRFSAFGAASAYNWGTTGAVADSEYTVVFGDIAGFNATQGKESVLVGGQAGINSTRSDRNVFVGFQTGPYSTAQSSVSDSVCVGYKAQTLASNTIALGNDIAIDTPGRMQLGGLQTTSALIRGVYDSTSAAAANVVVDQYGMLYRSSSSVQYKKDIEDLQDALAENILRMRPVWYRSKCDADKEDWSWFGLIAEEVAEIEPRLVSWRTHEAIKTVKNIEGKDVVVEVLKELDAPIAEGVHYDRLVPLLIKMLQKQQQQIDELMRSRI